MNMTPGQMKVTSELQGNAEISIEHKEYETKLDLLYDIAQQASSVSEVSDLLKEIPYIIQKILRASASSLFLVDEEKWQFRMRVVGDKKQKILEEITYSMDYGIAGWVARNNKPLVIDDVAQDERYQENIDAISGINPRSIIAAPLGRGSKVIGVLEIINKVDNGHFQKEDLGLLTEFVNTEALNLLVSMATTLMSNFKFCQSLQTQYKNTVETLVSFADAKDPYSYGHSRRVKEYSLITAEYLKLPPEELKIIEFGALLHDIGKLGIDDRILRKPESLTTEEWYIIRKHTIKGANIVRLIPSLQNTADLILYHHEHHDGKGYPEGLKGDQIPIGSQIIAVADAFETMTTDRAYRAAMTIDQAIDELNKNSGTQFSPKVVEAFISALNMHKGLLENLKHQHKPAEILKYNITYEDTSRNQAKLTDEQPAIDSASSEPAGTVQAVPEIRENKQSAGEESRIPAENISTHQVIDNIQTETVDKTGTTSETQENIQTAGEEPRIPAENISTQPVIDDTQIKETGEIQATSEKEEHKAPGNDEPENPAENTGIRPVTEKARTKESPESKPVPETYENIPEFSEILKILTENNGFPPVIEKTQKNITPQTESGAGNREKQKINGEVTKIQQEKADTESIVIDISKQKNKTPSDTSDLIRNKENQLDAAEMLKKLLGDVRTRKDSQEKKPVQPAAEKPASPAHKETSMPPKSQNAAAPSKPQEEHVVPKPKQEPAQPKAHEEPAKPRAHEEPSQPKAYEEPVQPKAHEEPVQPKAQEEPPLETMPESKEEQPSVEDMADRDDKETGKQKIDRKKAEKEAKLASKKAEREAKREKQEAKKAKKAKTAAKTIIDISSELFEGDVKLEITPFIDFKQTDRIKKYLLGIKNVKVISQGWSEEEGYIFFLSITEPTVLEPIFQQIPGVEKVYGDGKRIIAEGKPDENAIQEEPEDTLD